MHEWIMEREKRANVDYPTVVFILDPGFTENDIHYPVAGLIRDAPEKIHDKRKEGR